MQTELKQPRVTSETIRTRILDRQELVSDYGLGNLHQKIGGYRGGFVTWILHGNDHFSRIAKNGWTPESRKKRLMKHRVSLEKARAVLKANREARKRHGDNWIFEKFRERVLASDDPKAVLSRILSQRDPRKRS